MSSPFHFSHLLWWCSCIAAFLSSGVPIVIAVNLSRHRSNIDWSAGLDPGAAGWLSMRRWRREELAKWLVPDVAEKWPGKRRLDFFEP